MRKGAQSLKGDRVMSVYQDAFSLSLLVSLLISFSLLGIFIAAFRAPDAPRETRALNEPQTPKADLRLQTPVRLRQIKFNEPVLSGLHIKRTLYVMRSSPYLLIFSTKQSRIKRTLA